MEVNGSFWEFIRNANASFVIIKTQDAKLQMKSNDEAGAVDAHLSFALF